MTGIYTPSFFFCFCRDFVRVKEVSCKGQHEVEAGLYFFVAFLGAVAQANEPSAAVAQMVSAFLGAFPCNSGYFCVLGLSKGGVEWNSIGVKEKLAHQGVAEVTIRPFAQKGVAKPILAAVKGETVFVAPSRRTAKVILPPRPSETLICWPRM